MTILQSIDKVDALPSKVCKQSFDCSPRALRCACARVSGGNPRITRPQPIFDGRSGTSISCKMAFSALTGPKTLILRPEIDIGSGFQPPALGCRPAFAENDPLDHFPGASALLDLIKRQTCRRCASGPAAESRQPGCFASGESRRRIRGGKFTFPSDFPGFLGPEAHKLSSPQATGGRCRFFPGVFVRQVWVQGV